MNLARGQLAKRVRRGPEPTGAPSARSERVPPIALVLTGVTSIQFGAALAAHAVRRARAAAGTSLLRLGLRGARSCWRSGARACATTRASDLRLVGARSGSTLGGDEPRVLRGARAHPARHRGDDRVRRPAGRRGARARGAGADLVLGGARRRRASCCSPTRAAGRVDPLGLVCSSLAGGACWAAYILLAQRAGERLHAAARGWRSR